MILNKKIVIVLPAYNAEFTLEKTYKEIPLDMVDEVVLVDDASSDRTIIEAQRLGIGHIIRHERNKGYGANQKTCYDKALSLGADIVIMLHPDYQYTPRLIPSMAYLVAQNVYPVVLGSRILGKGALKGGMPLYKYIFNRGLTMMQNLLLGQMLSEYHTGYRAFSREVLENIPYSRCSDDYLFDNQMISQILYAGYNVAEITCPTRYFAEASSITLVRSLVYGVGVIRTSFGYVLNKLGWINSPLFSIDKGMGSKPP
ncbi:Undecaprenyl-phosphate 4-deoxy-4-formamido-L-arabinose transferase [Aquicella siphonis]|uniref:Undecaprenyl-phosphate 4-deoxy-4-formamido-L-arabinose transferase n=1 Tax=Aquicella siphonis TaxID=254247 RepID=A0A5E4PKH9_9COXI|nr:glycosyltransferase family 2 protein [Aquicella siphonis]VVC76843.1 Undecaprenyl-phosphate 4-deoxy-4-formamido-L-arabinose transferase [Aquicella siphonis]